MALTCAAMMLPAAAQWKPCDTCLTLLGNEQGLEYHDPKAIRKADGTTIFAYHTFGYHKNPDTGQKDPERYFYLHLQKFDKDGNKLFGDEGILVSYKPTMTATYGYLNLDTLSNGNILLTHSDVRYQQDTDPKIPFPEGNRSYAYCYTQDGQPVWSADGVEMPYYVADSSALYRLYAQEQIIASSDKIYFGVQIEEQLKNPETGVSYAHYFEMVCMDYDGNILSQRVDSTIVSYRYTLRPAPNGNAYMVFVNENDGYSAQAIGPDCKDVWAQPVVVEQYGVVSHDGTAVRTEEPRKAIVLNDGSLALVYKAFRANDGDSQLYYNRLYPDGTMLGHTMLTDTIGLVSDQTVLLEGDTLVLFEARTHPVSSDHEEVYLYYNRILLDGTPLYSAPYWVGEEANIEMNLLGVIRNGNYYELLVNEQDYNFLAAPSFSYTISVDGKKVFRKPIINDDLLVYEFVFMPAGKNANIIFTKEMFGAEGMWMASIDVTDHTHSAPETGELPGKFSVSADGKQIAFAKGNLQWLPYIPTFHFATAQWEARLIANTFVGSTLLEWIDLFGWGTGDNPFNFSSNNADYPTFNEWGNNPIQNSSYEAGTWRTMSQDEWDYILNQRPDAASKRGLGSINFSPSPNQYGYILLPDSFKLPEGLTFDPNADDYDDNSYEPQDWKKMQDNGAVYLPLAGYRTDTTLHEYDHDYARGEKAHYWTTTTSGESHAIAINIDKNGPVAAARHRAQGLAVRLVKDVDDPQGIEDVVLTDYKGKTRKILVNGVLYIIRDGKAYNAQGIKIYSF